jgi:DNA-binding LacI/PurR family transcriptional regulator
LTTVRMSCKDLAYSAVTDLIRNLNPDESAARPKPPIPTRLIVRQTTGLPRNALSDLANDEKSKPHNKTARK